MFWEYSFRSGFQTKVKQPAYMLISQGDTAQICLRRWSWWEKKKKGSYNNKLVICNWSGELSQHVQACFNQDAVSQNSTKRPVKSLMIMCREADGGKQPCGQCSGVVALARTAVRFHFRPLFVCSDKMNLVLSTGLKNDLGKSGKKKNNSQEALTKCIYWFSCEKKFLVHLQA